MPARNQICTCGHSFMAHTPEYDNQCDVCDCYEFEYEYDLTIRPQNSTGQSPDDRAKEWLTDPALQSAMDEYMQLSQEIEDSGVKYFASLTQKRISRHYSKLS